MKPDADPAFTPPRAGRRLLRVLLSQEEYEELLGDLVESSDRVRDTRGPLAARLWFWTQLLTSLPPLLASHLSWSVTMLKNYLKVAVRNIVRYKLYSFLNVFGLAIGLAACLLILLWVQDELSYDRFHEKADRIYRVERKYDFRDIHGQAPVTSGPYGPALGQDYPEIQDYVRYDKYAVPVRDHRHVFRNQLVAFADPSLFRVFDFRLVEGDPRTALARPHTLVLTRACAERFLGTADAVSRTLTLEWQGQPVPFEITGILEEVPANSHIHFELAASLSSYPAEQLDPWFNNSLITYVLLREGTAPAALQNKFPALFTKYMAADFQTVIGPDVDINEVFQLKLRPLLDIHLDPAAQHEPEPQGSMTTVYVFSAIALLILGIACINFMNLSTARANRRAREVCLRKTLGAVRRELRLQFLGESLLLALFALAVAGLFIALLLPWFNVVAEKQLTLAMLFGSWNWLIFLGITVATGLAAGWYPAVVLSAFEPARVLRGGARSGRGRTLFRGAMAVLQFIISITLIIGTLVVFQQMRYIQDKALGFDKENVVVIHTETSRVKPGLEAFRHALRQDTRVVAVSASSASPGNEEYPDTAYKLEGRDDIYSYRFMEVDYDFLDTFGLTMHHGRWFDRAHQADARGAIVINEAAARDLGLAPAEVVGRRLLRFVDTDSFQAGTIVGVVRDFHFRSLHQAIEPCVLWLTDEDIYAVSVRLRPGDVRGALGAIEGVWRTTFPGEDLQYAFMDQRLDRLYRADERMRRIFLAAAVLSIFVACLGLFGLAAYTAAERTREVGIRKVMGASVSGIVLLLSKEYTRWVLLANVVAWPLAWYLTDRWLQNFSYRVDLGVGVFVAATGLALAVALLTVMGQAWRAATADPVTSIRHE